MTYFDKLRPYLAKFLGPIIGALITGFIAYLKHRWGIQIDISDDDIRKMVETLGELVTFAVSSGISGVTLNKWVNPGNAASSHLASHEKAVAEVLKGPTVIPPVPEVSSKPLPDPGRRPNASGKDDLQDQIGMI